MLCFFRAQVQKNRKIGTSEYSDFPIVSILPLGSLLHDNFCRGVALAFYIDAGEEVVTVNQFAVE